MEVNAWRSMPFSQSFYFNVTLNSSLAEPMEIKGDYIHAVFVNEFDGLDHAEFEKPLRKIDSTFSQENKFRKDVQVVFDENVVNHQFLGLFYKVNMLSVTEQLMKLVPDNFIAFGKIASGFFTTTVFSHLFPDMLDEFNLNQKVDIRCGFSPSFLSGKIDDIYISQVQFNEGNRVKYSFHFGCGLFVHNTSEENPFMIL